AAAVGLVLDDAIVVVEHLAHESARLGTAYRRPAAMAGILPALVGSSLCTLCIFAPFVLLGGVTGAFFRVLALAMSLMLTASLVLPASVLLRAAVPRLLGAPPPAGGRPPGRLRSRLDDLMAGAAARPWVGVLPPALLLLALLPLHGALGSGFLPEMDEGSLI